MQGFGYGTDGSGVIQHAYLYGYRWDIRHNRLDLPLDIGGRHGVDACYSAGVLYGDGGYGACRIGSQGRNGLDVCLYAGSSAAIGTGDGQYAWVVFHVSGVWMIQVAKVGNFPLSCSDLL